MPPWPWTQLPGNSCGQQIEANGGTAGHVLVRVESVEGLAAREVGACRERGPLGGYRHADEIRSW